ncbi:MAG TPA: ester cyclase [Vicinamibacterales bacterium]|nr:ester cyclase [Vicinamibacterales bacterium]
MTRMAIERLLARQKDAFARRDVDALTAIHAPDGTFESPAYGVLTGRQAIHDVYVYWYRAFPDFMLTWESALIDPPRASYFWTFTGTAAGPFFGEVKVGSKVTMIGAAEAAFSEDEIISIRHVFDFSGTLLRAGVLKVKPS